MTSFLVADDHVTVRMGVEILLKDLFDGRCTIHHASNGHEVLNQLQRTTFDVFIMDMNMPEPGGLLLLEKALALQKHLKVLIVSVSPDAIYAPQAIKLGAIGFINKNANDQELKKAIRVVTKGGTWLHESVKNKSEEHAVFNQLSTRELQVARLLMKGNGVLEVSNILGISTSATSTMKGRIFRKLSIDSLVALYELGRQHSLQL